MRRATTPTHVFTLPSLASEYSDIHITYAQGDTKVLEKNKADLTIDGKTVSYTMTQQETKLFSPPEAQVQIRARTTGGKVFASQIMYFKVMKVLCDDILPLEVADDE